MNNDRIEVNVGGRDFVFAVEIEPDYDHGAPWDNEDGHGPVSEWTTRAKQPGEMVLSRDRRAARYYDFQGAVKLALKDGWGYAGMPNDEPLHQRAAKAAMADYERLRGWCNDEWHYVGVIVTLLDDDGEPTDIWESVWGVEDDCPDYLKETARTLADEIACGYGTRWGEGTKKTYDYF